MEAIEIITAFLLSLSFLLLMWDIKGLLLKPVIGKKNSKVTVVITAGAEPKYLEHEIRGLRWLRSDGILRADVLIVDVGMDKETEEIAYLLSKNDPSVLICRPNEIENIIIRGSVNGGNG